MNPFSEEPFFMRKVSFARLVIFCFTIILIGTTCSPPSPISATSITDNNPIDPIIDITFEYPFENKVQALQEDGTILFWKEPDSQVTNLSTIPLIQKGPTLSGAIKITGNHLVLKEDGTVWQWDQKGDDNTYIVSQIKELNHIVDLQSSLKTDIALDKNGVAWIRSNENTIPQLFAPHIQKNSKKEKEASMSFQRAQTGVEAFYLYKESIGDNNILVAKKDGTWEYYYFKYYKTGKELKGVLKGKLPKSIHVQQIIGHEHLNAPKEINQAIVLLTTDGKRWRSTRNKGWQALPQNDREYTNINLIQGNYDDSMLFLSLDHNGNVSETKATNEAIYHFNITKLSHIKKMLARENGEGIALDEQGYVWRWKTNNFKSSYSNLLIENVIPTLVIGSSTGK